MHTSSHHISMTDKTISTSDTGTQAAFKLQDLITLDSGCSSGALDPFMNLLQQWRRQLAADGARPRVWPTGVALDRSHMWRKKRPKIKLMPFKLAHSSGRTQPTCCVTHPGSTHDHSASSAAAVQRVDFYEALSVGSKAVAALPPGGLLMNLSLFFFQI